jgi:hypothetical protein
MRPVRAAAESPSILEQEVRAARRFGDIVGDSAALTR